MGIGILKPEKRCYLRGCSAQPDAYPWERGAFIHEWPRRLMFSETGLPALGFRHYSFSETVEIRVEAMSRIGNPLVGYVIIST